VLLTLLEGGRLVSGACWLCGMARARAVARAARRDAPTSPISARRRRYRRSGPDQRM